MKRIHTFLGALAIATSTVAVAENPWYLGATLGGYRLDSDRAIEGDFRGYTAGAQIGKYVSEKAALEFGFGGNIGHDDFDVYSLNGVFWMGDDAKKWRPYALLGVNHYDFEPTSNLELDHDESSNQILAGLGLGKMFSENYQFRADVRAMSSFDEDGEDVGVQLSINRLFGQASSAPVPAPAAEPAVAAEPAPAPVVEEAPEAEEPRTITVRLNVEFEFNSDVVRAVYGDQLETIAAAMNAYDDIQLVLEGHTDSKGSDTYNQDLSDRRAKAVKAKLVSDYGIPADRISAVGCGESRPIDTNDTEEGRARNRRVIGEMSYTELPVN